MLLWLSLLGLVQHLCSASIIRNIVSVCTASFSALGSFLAVCLVWVFQVQGSGALQGDQMGGSVTAPCGALGGALWITAGTKADVILPKVWIRMED